MAQDITLLGASYTAVPAVNLPKTGGGTATFTDVSDTTATAADVAQGKYFYLADGTRVAGTAPVGPLLDHIDATYTQSGTVYNTDSLDSLKADLVVVATYDNSATLTVPAADYTLSGSLTVGTSTITVTYGGVTDTFEVTVTQYVPSLDTVIYEGLSYRDIFITANQVHGFDFENGLPSGCTTNSGSPSITTDDAYSGTHSLKAFGTSSQQYKSANTTGVADWNRYANKKYFAAFKVKVTRYSKGNIGVSTSPFPAGPKAVTDGWQTYYTYQTSTTGTTNNVAYIGSRSSANLDGYVDDIVLINMTDTFTDIPSQSDLVQWYNEYCDIRKAGGN